MKSKLLTARLDHIFPCEVHLGEQEDKKDRNCRAPLQTSGAWMKSETIDTDFVECIHTDCRARRPWE
jgi:hypothetical protein